MSSGGFLELAEDMADIRAAEAARAEMKATGEQPIPWAEVRADLGLGSAIGNVFLLGQVGHSLPIPTDFVAHVRVREGPLSFAYRQV